MSAMGRKDAKERQISTVDGPAVAKAMAGKLQIYAHDFPGENSGHDFIELYLRTSASIRGCSLLFVSIRLHSWLICGS
jgi:hypothetical protein